MPSFLFVVLMWLAPSILIPIDKNAFRYLLAVVSITSFVIPMIMLTSLKLTAIIPDYYLEDRKHRIIPFIFVTIIYGASCYMFYNQFNFAKVIYQCFFSITLLLFVLTAITIFWKISIHSAAISGVFGILYALQIQNPDVDLLYLLTTFLVLIGIVGTSRMKLNAHTIEQTIAGILVGFACCFLVVWFWGF
jgi:membrane-associated phospholipid phosphatase